MSHLVAGQFGRMKSATEGCISVRIIEVRGGLNLWPPSDPFGRNILGGAMIGGPEELFVEFLEGKHRGDTRWVPHNYVEAAAGARAPSKELTYAEMIDMAKSRGLTDAHIYSEQVLRQWLRPKR